MIDNKRGTAIAYVMTGARSVGSEPMCTELMCTESTRSGLIHTGPFGNGAVDAGQRHEQWLRHSSARLRPDAFLILDPQRVSAPRRGVPGPD